MAQGTKVYNSPLIMGMDSRRSDQALAMVEYRNPVPMP